MFPEEFDRDHIHPRERSRAVIRQLKPEVIALVEAVREAGVWQGRVDVLESKNHQLEKDLEKKAQKIRELESTLEDEIAMKESWIEEAEKLNKKVKKVAKNERRSRSKN